MFSVEGEKITCLRASVQFGRGGVAVAAAEKKKIDVEELVMEDGVDL